MLIDVKIIPSAVRSDADLRGKTVVVIDTLRATSTIVQALRSGAREVIPTDDIEDAVATARRLGSERTLLCGERNSVRIEGFDLGNSPLEYTADVVDGKSLVMVTTNGTVALRRSMVADRVFCGALVNAGALARTIQELGVDELTIICAGTYGNFSLDDVYGAGGVIERIESLGGVPTLTDGAAAARMLYREIASDLHGAMRATGHGRTLLKLGFDADVEFCSRLDIPDAPVPALDGSMIRAFRH